MVNLRTQTGLQVGIPSKMVINFLSILHLQFYLKCEKVLHCLRLCTILLQDLSKLVNSNSGTRWGNQVGMFLLPVYYHRRGSDPIHYVKKAKNMIDKKKLSLEASYSYKVGKLIMSLFGAKVNHSYTLSLNPFAALFCCWLIKTFVTLKIYRTFWVVTPFFPHISVRLKYDLLCN